MVNHSELIGSDTGDSYFFSLCEAPDGDFVLLGGTTAQGGGGEDMYLVKVKRDGESVFEKTFGNEASDYGKRILRLQDGYLLIGGTQAEAGDDFNIRLVKVDFDGTRKWDKTRGNTSDELVADGQLIPGGGFIVAGKSKSPDPARAVALLAKYDAAGNPLWRQVYKIPNADTGFECVQPTSDGGYIAAGNACADETAQNIVVIKTDSQGNKTWGGTYTTTGDNGANCVLENAQHQFFVGGYLVGGEYSRESMYLMKLDALGEPVWSYAYYSWDGSWDAAVQAMILNRDGGLLLSGYCLYSNGLYRSQFIKTDYNGRQQWMKRLDLFAGDEEVRATVATGQDDYAVAGYACAYDRITGPAFRKGTLSLIDFENGEASASNWEKYADEEPATLSRQPLKVDKRPLD